MLTPVLAYSKLTRVYLENIIHVISSKHIHDINWLNYNISSRWNLRPGYDSPNPNHHSSDVTTWGHYNPFRTRGVCVYIYMYIYIYWIFQPNILQKLNMSWDILTKDILGILLSQAYVLGIFVVPLCWFEYLSV
jgi:hypothetical protein